jgi:hypothetical protein
LRITGQVDNFNGSFEVILENFELVKSFKEQYYFGLKLHKNYQSISKTNIFDLHKVTESTSSNLTTTDGKARNLYSHKKNFANRLLAFFQNFQFTNETSEDGFVEVKLEILFKNPEFTKMLEDYCIENNIQDVQKFFRECCVLLEKHSLGTIVDNNYLEIKIDNVRVKNEILAVLGTNRYNATNYINIYDYICKQFENFYCTDYVKFIMNEMLDAGVIYQSGPNEYNIVL